jgi:hypothetical protein
MASSARAARRSSSTAGTQPPGRPPDSAASSRPEAARCLAIAYTETPRPPRQPALPGDPLRHIEQQGMHPPVPQPCTTTLAPERTACHSPA